MKEKQEKIAYIESVATDQGNGGSWCSHCKYSLSDYLWARFKKELEWVKQKYEGKNPGELEKRVCPGCGYKLKSGGPPYIPTGGSDF